MAIIWVNATAMGAQRLSGAQRYDVRRGAAQSGDITIAIDNTKVTNKGQIRQAVLQILDTIGDQVK